MGKSRKRADRRWRSYHKFIRRLKQDWWEHGWRRDPAPRMYSSNPNWDGTTLCTCFYDKKAQARFKDTPNSCGCWQCANPRRANAGKKSEELTVHELRINQTRDDFHVRKRRDGFHKVKISCSSCGILIKIVEVRNGHNPSRIELCDRCDNGKKILCGQ